MPTMTPEQMAAKVLAAITPSTDVSVGTNLTVADRPAYQLVVAPKDPASTVGQIAIAVDATTGQALQVVDHGSGCRVAGAVQLGFTVLSTTAPPASAFTFTPPPGAAVTTHDVGGAGSAGIGQGHTPSTGTRQPGVSPAGSPSSRRWSATTGPRWCVATGSQLAGRARCRWSGHGRRRCRERSAQAS